MVVIVFGDNNEVFETNAMTIPSAIVQLYEIFGGRVGKELFDKTIRGMNNTANLSELVIMFETLVAANRPIKKIYVAADKYYDNYTEE